MLILNGRKTGDLFGRYTCHNWNGSSVVDYVLSPNQFCNKISNFSVGKYIPWLSDHCIIKTTILLNDTFSRKTSVKNDLTTLLPGFAWDEESKTKYRDGLQSQDVTTKIHTLLRSPNPKPVELAVEIKKILMNNAKTTNLRPKKVLNKSQQEDKPWFDKECRDIKKCLNTLGNNLKQAPGDQSTRTALLEQKRNLRKVALAKKRRYKKNIMKELANSKHDRNQKEFWKILNKISPKNKSDPIQPPFPEFVKHFKETFHSDKHRVFHQ